jgi:hypothetical protein
MMLRLLNPGRWHIGLVAVALAAAGCFDYRALIPPDLLPLVGAPPDLFETRIVIGGNAQRAVIMHAKPEWNPLSYTDVGPFRLMGDLSVVDLASGMTVAQHPEREISTGAVTDGTWLAWWIPFEPGVGVLNLESGMSDRLFEEYGPDRGINTFAIDAGRLLSAIHDPYSNASEIVIVDLVTGERQSQHLAGFPSAAGLSGERLFVVLPPTADSPAGSQIEWINLADGQRQSIPVDAGVYISLARFVGSRVIWAEAPANADARDTLVRAYDVDTGASDLLATIEAPPPHYTSVTAVSDSGVLVYQYVFMDPMGLAEELQYAFVISNYGEKLEWAPYGAPRVALVDITRRPFGGRVCHVAGTVLGDFVVGVDGNTCEVVILDTQTGNTRRIVP